MKGSFPADCSCSAFLYFSFFASTVTPIQNLNQASLQKTLMLQKYFTKEHHWKTKRIKLCPSYTQSQTEEGGF